MCERYRENLRDVPGIRFLVSESTENANYAYFPVIFEKEFPLSRNEVYEKLVENRVFARKYFYPLTCDQACFRNRHRNDVLPVARYLSENVLTLPLYEELNLEDVDYICSLIQNIG